MVHVGRRLSIRVRRRPLVLAGLLLTATAVVAGLSLTLGEPGIAPGALVPTILGTGGARDTIVFEAFRGPRLWSRCSSVPRTVSPAHCSRR